VIQLWSEHYVIERKDENGEVVRLRNKNVGYCI